MGEKVVCGMTNAEKFRKSFGFYATELWSMQESDFLDWLNGNSNAKLNKLKPCPFCGGEAKVVEKFPPYYIVECTKCPASVGRMWFGERSEAVDAWNQREGDTNKDG